MTSPWWLVVTIVGFVVLGVVLQRYEQRMKEADRQRRRKHRDLKREVGRHPRIEPVEPRRPR